jgi:RNAse (barnase) inhibitor barstar
MDSETIRVKQTIAIDLTFKDFKKALKTRKYSKEQLQTMWNVLKKDPNLGRLIILYGSLADRDDEEELFVKPMMKELKTIIADCLELAIKEDD